MSESSYTATSSQQDLTHNRDQQHPSVRAGIHPKPLHPSQILRKPDRFVKNLKEFRSQNLQFPTGHGGRKTVLGEMGLLWVLIQDIQGFLVCATAEPGLQQPSEYMIYKYRIYREIPGTSAFQGSAGALHSQGPMSAQRPHDSLLASHTEVNISPLRRTSHTDKIAEIV